MCRYSLFAVAAVFGTVGAVLAEAPATEPAPPKSPAARAAMAKHDAAVKAAMEAYTAALLTAKRDLVTELDSALRTAMKAGDLVEANAINLAKASAAGEIAGLGVDRPAAKVRPKVIIVKVSVKDKWKPVGRVRKGDMLDFSVTGEWLIAAVTRDRTWGPDGDGKRGMFMAKVGDTVYPVGAKNTIEIKEDGTLCVGCDESDGGGKGDMMATIKLYRGGKPVDTIDR